MQQLTARSVLDSIKLHLNINTDKELALNDKELALIWPETIEELQNIVNEFILRSQSFPMKLDFAQELANECDEIIEMLTVLVSFFKLQVEINKAKNVVIDRLI